MSSKYDPLQAYLESKPKGEFTLTFRQMEDVLGFGLPASATRPQWWANVTGDAHTQARSWRNAGFDAFLVAGSKKVRFRSR